ncbi:MAG: hypothetical protein KFW07_01990 [Mycoplasmataceae bacterium]|nr:hypothetical protein [Mycoplasmataceae bacterium]
MKDYEDVWKKQFGLKDMTAQDFAGVTIDRQFYRDETSPLSWDIYGIEGSECIVVSSATFKQMPQDWEENFFVDGKEYQFIMNKNGGFGVYLLEDIDIENKNHKDVESIIVEEFDTVNVDEVLSEQQQFNFRKSEPIPEYKKNNSWNSQNNKSNEDAYIIWESIFGDETAIEDFAGKSIVKYEFNANTKNSWSVDYYDEMADDAIFIASVDTIIKRNGRKNFFIDNIEYNIVIKNGKYIIVSSEEPDKILLSPELLSNEIEKYFPSFFTNNKVTPITIPNYASLVINLAFFPVQELEKLRIMLQKLLRDINIFQDIFIYSSEEESVNNRYGNNCYIRIFFKSNNLISEDIKIFDISLILKNIMALAMINIRTIYNLNDSTNFTMFLANHNQNYKFISWFTNNEIDRLEPRPIRANKGEFIVDSFYFELFINFKGYSNSFVILTSKMNNTFYLCNLDINNMGKFIENQSRKNKQRFMR